MVASSASRNWRWRTCLVGVTILLTATSVVAAEPAPQDRFGREVLPILTARCLKCHGEKKQSGGLDLRSKPAMLRGGDSGPALTPGAAAKSLLFDLVRQGKMPPPKEARLSAQQIAVIKAWIDAGAPAETAVADGLFSAEDRKHWAFQKSSSPAVPHVKSVERRRTPVDAFILDKLDAKGLTLAADADRTTLIRRATFALLGLPPAPEEVAAFLADHRPDAYERLLDRLLTSPHFGERWGRHWLDAAGYVDVIGGDNDAATVKLGAGKWRYRDYVIRSLNQDKPFDRFLTEQLAGDELVDWRGAATFTPEIKELLIATGFLRTAPDDTDENELNKLREHHFLVQKTGEVVVSNLLALTFSCAKCHNHKFEPIPQRDYYRFLALFTPAFNPQKWLQPKTRGLADVAPVVKLDIDRHNADIDQQVDEFKKQQAALRKPREERLQTTKSLVLPEAIRGDTLVALRTPAAQRNAVQKYLASKFEASLKVSTKEVDAGAGPMEREQIAGLERRIAEHNGKRRSWETLQAVYDVGPAPATFLLKRGEHEQPGIEVPPGFLEVLGGLSAPPSTSTVSTATSGRRLALANTLTDPQGAAGALVARVQVNRIWLHLFGRGLVETADNFGRSGAVPSHPELLEWLAYQYLHGERRLKPLLRLLMTSSVYRQASARGDTASVDAENVLLWKMRLRRIESESVRDALLAVSGRLDATHGGPPIPLEVLPDGMVVVKRQGLPTPTSAARRSIYLLARRAYHPTLLDVFDQPLLASNCVCRKPASVVTQSLTMLNDTFVQELADDLALRVERYAVNEPPEKRIEWAFRIALARPPRPQEAAWSAELLQRHTERYRAASLSADQSAHKALTHLCHMLLNTSEFLYIP